MPRRNRPSHRRTPNRPGRNLSSRARAELGERAKARKAEASPTVCPHGKRGYPEHVAKAKLEQYRQDDEGKNRRRPTRVYLCQLCDSWHLTSEAPR